MRERAMTEQREYGRIISEIMVTKKSDVNDKGLQVIRCIISVMVSSQQHVLIGPANDVMRNCLWSVFNDFYM